MVCVYIYIYTSVPIAGIQVIINFIGACNESMI